MADIIIGDLTNGSVTQDGDGEYVWTGTGVFDKLMMAVNGNIKVEFDNGRIVGPDYADVYLGSLQSVIAQSVQYNLQEQLTEAQINKINVDIALAQANAVAQVDKVMGYAHTLDADGNVIVGADTTDGKLDYDNNLVIEKTESEAMNNMADGVIEKQILKIIEDTKLVTANELLTDRKVL